MKKSFLKIANEYDFKYKPQLRQKKVTSEIVNPEAIRDQIEKFDFKEPMSRENLINKISELLDEYSLHVTHPRYLGLFNPSVSGIAVAADAMVAAYNPQLAVWSHAPLACEIERMVLSQLSKKIGFNPSTSFSCFTSGGQESNLTATITALTHIFKDFDLHGVRSIEGQPIFYVSEQAHHSFHKVAHAVGLGRNAVKEVPVNSRMQLNIDRLRAMIIQDRAKGGKPFMIAATAGTTAAGIVDPLNEMADIANEFNLWYHVDAAWGGGALLSSLTSKYLNGIDQADSVTWDAHKWLSVPMGAGMFFCKNGEAVNKSFRITTSYMPSPENDTIDPYSTTLQWSRRFIGLKVFMTIAEVGWPEIDERIGSQFKVGQYLRVGLKDQGYTIHNNTLLPVICFNHRQIASNELLRKNKSARSILAIYS
ncbi:pyridoxal phosphate-dependent decarboxylase family protein [Piscirickettsia litoralis]|uniref:Pyridoxal-dependent decarboxylase n=1 Tax=Piscirickettsia litoralis TaxID=1891921 RepID=A0ABX3A5C6_9GAMM|nr:pyridoxal-dependent decarboxylase [Piscirickettsia litoralis]ODN41309.1 hypothetical protein BGC07_17250 [Piscirickettsia litoralis]